MLVTKIKKHCGLCDWTAESSFKLLIEMTSKMSSQRKEANMKLKVNVYSIMSKIENESPHKTIFKYQQQISR